MGQDTNEVFLCVFALACMRFHLGAVYVFAYSVCRTPIPAHGRGRGLVKCSAGVAVPIQKTVREPVKGFTPRGPTRCQLRGFIGSAKEYRVVTCVWSASRALLG